MLHKGMSKTVNIMLFQAMVVCGIVYCLFMILVYILQVIYFFQACKIFLCIVCLNVTILEDSSLGSSLGFSLHRGVS